MLVLSLEHVNKILSISLCNKNFLFYKEIYGDFVSSNNLITTINLLINKNHIKYNKISYIIIGYDLTRLTSIKIIYSVIQSLSIAYCIPLFKISSISAFTYFAINYTEKKYILIFSNNNIYYLYFKYKKHYFLIFKDKTIDVASLNLSVDCLFFYNNILPIKNKIQYKIISLKSVYLNSFLKKFYNTQKHITPNSSSIKYIKNITYSEYK